MLFSSSFVFWWEGRRQGHLSETGRDGVSLTWCLVEEEGEVDCERDVQKSLPFQHLFAVC